MARNHSRKLSVVMIISLRGLALRISPLVSLGRTGTLVRELKIPSPFVCRLLALLFGRPLDDFFDDVGFMMTEHFRELLR